MNKAQQEAKQFHTSVSATFAKTAPVSVAYVSGKVIRDFQTASNSEPKVKVADSKKCDGGNR